MDSKHCNRCFQLLPLVSFGRVSAAKDGRGSRCRPCVSLDNKERMKKLSERKNIPIPPFKHCPRCDKDKRGVEFYVSRSQKDGRATYCRACTKETASERQRIRRAELDAFKADAGCKDCGYDDNPRRLEFDHLPGSEKMFNVSEGVLYPRDELYAEIAKCEVVCQPCHSKRTTQRMREARLCMTVSL